ncbi:LD-carboxypeptidase [Cecembia sp.]|uniref:S66 peptidase family protein n=1 Tax=Cecembia sp. TaxID=1898110 RepID=UPI0025C115A7|nr:LD-carboxypeptidase [Cecembia sp.]
MNKRLFLKSLGLGLVGFPLSSSILPESPAKKVLLPNALQRGDKVGLISPSAATADRIQFKFAQETLEALGFEVVLGLHWKNRRGHLAGTDAERAEDLNKMFADSSIKALICIRGGSGAARILPLIDYKTIQRNPKPILGYSDITALHCAIHTQTGLITFHGPNGTGSWNSFNVQQFEKMFFEKELVAFENEQVKGDDLIVKQNRIQTIRSGKASGKILGGNLTVLTALSGTPYFPDFKNSILFLEDIGEDPYKIDRMLSTLALNGTLSKIKGFIFGQCTDCSPSGGYGSLTLDDILDDYILPLNIPAFRGAMIGHVSKQFIVPVGAQIEMDADAGTFRLLDKVFQK